MATDWRKIMSLNDLGFSKKGQALYKKIIALQEELKSQQVIPEDQFNQDIVADMIRDGAPLISKLPPCMGRDTFQDTIHRLCLLFIQYVPERKGEIEEIMNLRSQFYAGMDIQAILKEHTQIKAELLALILENAYRPYYLALAEKLRNLNDLNTWEKHYCPVCGETASLASLDEQDGQRFLWCSYCTTGWHFRRLACLECGNINHEELKYFYLEDDSNLQVHTCTKCKSYIKTVRRGVIKQKNLPLIDAQTVCLDLLAEREGYRR